MIRMNGMKEDARKIMDASIAQVLPDAAVQKALEGKTFSGKVIVVAIGKAAWNMARATKDMLGSRITEGFVLTKYEHCQGDIEGFTLLEAGHPLPDENTILGTNQILNAVKNLEEKDTVVFLISGGGSALFESPAGDLTLEDMLDVTNQLLKSGADIVEMNAIRKHLSNVKGGRFAQLCAPAQVFAIALSDILGDRVDAIASGPATPDASTCADALAVIEKYQLKLSQKVMEQLRHETPKEIHNSQVFITGSVSQLCDAAAKEAETLGYTPYILSSLLDCEAKEAGRFLASMGKSVQNGTAHFQAPCALICGGETVVRITGTGKGGRNQELALSAAASIAGLEGIVVGAVGSDGTDGPTDAAGGLVDGNTKGILDEKGISIDKVLFANDSNAALQVADALVMTGPTGTNVNDLYFVLCK